jgi:hypothetical protein
VDNAGTAFSWNHDSHGEAFPLDRLGVRCWYDAR